MKTVIKVLVWSARVFSILAILFVSMFALDSFRPGISLEQQILHFLVHLIPSYILTAILVFAWKWELWGGVVFVSLGLALAPVIFIHNYRMTHHWEHGLFVVLLINGPFILVGAMFILCHFLKKKAESK